MSRTAQNMKKLIEKKYYATAEEALVKLDVFFMAGRITDEEYTDLCLLVEQIYNPLPAEEETPVEEVVEQPVE